MGNRVTKYWVKAVIALGVLSVSTFISGCRLGVNEPARMVHKGVGTPFDLQGFIDTALASGQKRVVVPPGRYRVKPQHCCHLRLRDLQDVEMVCTETTLALAIDNCRNLSLRGLTIDYDPLPFTPGRIVAMAPDKTWLELEIIEDIRLYASNCFSYLEHDCDGTTYRRCSIDRRPLAEDFQPRGLRRLRSSDADAFHSKHAVRGPQIISCTAKYQGDDCVNFCGEKEHKFMENTSKTPKIIK